MKLISTNTELANPINKNSVNLKSLMFRKCL